MTTEEEVDLPEGFRPISSIAPGERARIDQSIADTREVFALLCWLMEHHQRVDHEGIAPCELPCGSIAVYRAIQELDAAELRKILYAVVHDVIRQEES